MMDAAEIVRRVVAAGAPVLCLDSCALLDLMRDPSRDKFNGAHALAALHLLDRAEATPQALSIVIAQQVAAEVAEHMDNIQSESERVLVRLDETVNRILGVVTAYGLPSPAGPAISQLGLSKASRAIVERFIAVAMTAREEADYPVRAWGRVQAGRAPASRAKQSVKDCVIIETYLESARLLRAAGFPEKVLFLTSNTADYAEGARSSLHGDLAGDFAAAKIDFATDFLAARYAF